LHRAGPDGFNSQVPPSQPRPDNPLETDDTEDDLDEFETGLYLCRWPNGEFSLVKADDRKDAVVQLDEWAGALANPRCPRRGIKTLTG